MTPAQTARRQRLRAATCSIHGFGRNQLGQLMFGRHVEEIARTVEEALERKGGRHVARIATCRRPGEG